MNEQQQTSKPQEDIFLNPPRIEQCCFERIRELSALTDFGKQQVALNISNQSAEIGVQLGRMIDSCFKHTGCLWILVEMDVKISKIMHEGNFGRVSAQCTLIIGDSTNIVMCGNQGLADLARKIGVIPIELQSL